MCGEMGCVGSSPFQMMDDIESMGNIIELLREEQVLLGKANRYRATPGPHKHFTPTETTQCNYKTRRRQLYHSRDEDEENDKDGDYVCCSKQRDKELMRQLYQTEELKPRVSHDKEFTERNSKIIDLEHKAKDCLNAVAKKYAVALRMNLEMNGLHVNMASVEEELSPKQAKRQRQKAIRERNESVSSQAANIFAHNSKYTPTSVTSLARSLTTDLNSEFSRDFNGNDEMVYDFTPLKGRSASFTRSASAPNLRTVSEWQQLYRSADPPLPILPDAIMFLMLGYLGDSIVAGSASCRRWRQLALFGAGSDSIDSPRRFCFASDAILARYESDNALLKFCGGLNRVVKKRPYYSGRVVIRNDIHASWRALTPGDVPSWEALPGAAARWIMTHASWEELLDGPKIQKSPMEWQELLAQRFTQSMMPDSAPSGRNNSSKKTAENMFSQALIQERDQTRLYARFSCFDSLLPLSIFGLAFQANVVVLDADKKNNHQPRDVNHHGFNLMALVFGNYNFTANGAGQRARMQYFFDVAGDQDSVEWMNDVPAPRTHSELAASEPEFQARWEAIREVDVYTVNESDALEEDDDFEFYEDRLIRVFWRGRFMLCFWFRLGFCAKDGVGPVYTNANSQAERLLSKITGGSDWARYPQYNTMHKCERIPVLCAKGDEGHVVGKLVVFGGIAHDVYNEDDYNVSFSQGLQITVLPFTVEDFKEFEGDLETANDGKGALVEVFTELDQIADSPDESAERIQGYDHANMEQMVWHIQL